MCSFLPVASSINEDLRGCSGARYVNPDLGLSLWLLRSLQHFAVCWQVPLPPALLLPPHCSHVGTQSVITAATSPVRHSPGQAPLLLRCRALGYPASPMGLGGCAQQVVVTSQLRVVLQLASIKFAVIRYATYK